jgi:hypothetical protein
VSKCDCKVKLAEQLAHANASFYFNHAALAARADKEHVSGGQHKHFAFKTGNGQGDITTKYKIIQQKSISKLLIKGLPSRCAALEMWFVSYHTFGHADSSNMHAATKSTTGESKIHP